MFVFKEFAVYHSFSQRENFCIEFAMGANHVWVFAFFFLPGSSCHTVELVSVVASRAELGSPYFVPAPTCTVLHDTEAVTRIGGGAHVKVTSIEDCMDRYVL